MANPEHLEILKQGVEQWNKWREERRFTIVADHQPFVAEADLSGADLRGANLCGADLTSTDFQAANLSEADLRKSRLEGANLRKARLVGANLREVDCAFTKFAEANLTDADLNRADLHSARFDAAILRAADLGNADCRHTDFHGANLTEADLGRADLSLADFGNANLARAKMGHANLRKANLAGADFKEAHVGATTFTDVDLSLAVNLESVRHDGPSHIGIDTIYKSHGKIPQVFLRGCGVPDEFIAYIGSMVGRPIEFYSCFISYSTKDQEFADRLYADLQAKGVRCWFAPHDIQGGRTIHEQIDEAIRRYDRLLLILSEHSIHSGWVETEIANAWERQIQQGKHVLFPVRLVSFEELEKWKCPDPKTGKDLGREIRKYFIPDFSNWKEHDPYQTAFQKLVESLKSSG